MKISDITIKTFRTTADRFDVGYARPMPDTELLQTVLTIHTDEGVEGHYFGGGSHGDAEGLNVVDQQAILWRIKDLLVGQDPMDREMIWKWLWVANVQENVASVIDNALWDLAGSAEAGSEHHRGADRRLDRIGAERKRLGEAQGSNPSQ